MTQINIYPRYKQVDQFLELYPPQPINRFLPDWYKKQKVNTKQDFYAKEPATYGKSKC